MPTSLTYIVLSARGCSPWRPAAVMSTSGRENHSFPQIFKGLQPRTELYQRCRALPILRPYLLANNFHGLGSLTRKENSSRGRCRRLWVHLRCRITAHPLVEQEYRNPRSGSGILTRFPFDVRSKRIRHLDTAFAYLLGSTNPCPTAVHMEPFSTSVFKVLI